MKWFIILACFVAAQFAHGAHVKVVQQDPDSGRINLDLEEIEGTVQSCNVTPNKGEKITLRLNEPLLLEPSINVGLEFKKQDYYRNKYYIKIKNPTADLNGKWIVKVETEKETKTIEFYIQKKKISTYQPLTIYTFKDQYVVYKFPIKFTNLEFCILINKNGLGYDILSEENDHLSLKEPYNCGVRIQVNETGYKTRHLYASDVNSSVTHEAEITWSTLETEDHKLQTEYFQRGKQNIIKFSTLRSSGMTYCQLEDPSGKKLPIQVESCSYVIPYVTDNHNGTWKIYYGVKGSIQTMETNKTIIVYDQVTPSVKYGEKEINLLCQVRDNTRINYCLFTRPDNLTLSITTGIGNETYQYYGNGEQSRDSSTPNIYDCGVTIRSPSKEDFGTWKCAIYIEKQIIGTILNVTNSSSSFSNRQSTTTMNQKVFVQKGNPFTVKCSAPVVLDYCWMLSPNGTIYSVSKNGSSPSDLTYKGSGLEFGECEAVVEVADNTHQGEWSCRMVFNKTEMAAGVSVTVTDSLLIADENTIDITYKTPTILNCQVLPGSDNVINYCRWIRPDGLGIYNNVDNKYVTKETLSSCKLTIQDINVQHDIGSWICAAGIAGREIKEVTTQIEIKYSYMGLGGIISVILAIALLVITTITLFVIIVRRRSNRLLNEKVLQYKS